MLDLNGLIFHHRDFGYCKITGQADSTVRVNFISTNRDSWYGIQSIAAQKEFKWRPLPVGLKCNVSNRGNCTIIESAFAPDSVTGVHEYLIKFDEEEGLTARVSERELRPIPGSLIETPITRLISLQPDPFNHYRVREGFRTSLRQLNRESDGISSMVGSRIELLPHQAYVVRNIIDDPICRYILADEVGLGKTIEAGIIAHQLLADKPDAKILVLTPGPLARQWLCEMRVSFVGRDFRLLDLHSQRSVTLNKWPLVISSLKVAMRTFKAQIQQINWDLVIVDEAHQLLWHKNHYDFIQYLAGKVPRLLLLSAVPARERAEELLRLLRLIEPNRYVEGSLIATRFTDLYAVQSTIGRRWKIFSRGIDKGNENDITQLHKDAQRLLSSPILEQDEELHSLYRQAMEAPNAEDTINLYRTLADEVVSRYRLSRRILKNRRSQLTEREMFHAVERMVQFVEYSPSDLERETEQLILELLANLSVEDQPTETLLALTRKVLQAICDPVALYEIATAMVSGENEGEDLTSEFDSSWVFDYAEHENLINILGNLYGIHLDQELLKRWISLLRASIDLESQPRVECLINCIDSLIAQENKKILLFAGTPGSAEFVADHLKRRFGKTAVASFRHDLSDDDKEHQVAHFRNDSNCTILVSDESGGEGRNFQFADCVIHFDLPWSVAAVEQRIGRLDRVGRTLPVRSYVIYPKDGIEQQWAKCLDRGFRVFTHSISGLEFMLRTQEHAVLKTVLESSAPDLDPLIAQIFEASEVERASDDAEAITDAASFKSRGHHLRAIRSDIDTHLEQFLPGFMRTVSRPDAAKKVTDIKNANLKIWRLRPEDITEIKLLGLEREGDNPLRERFGTFDRLIARERQDLEFFSVGHPIVDSLAHAMNQHVRGRCFFVSTSTNTLPKGLYFYCQWHIAQNNENSFLPERVKRLVATRSINVALDIYEQELLSEDATKIITSILGDTNNSFSDISTEKAVEIIQPEQGEWSQTINNLISKSSREAESVYFQRYQQADSLMILRWQNEIDYIRCQRPDEDEEYTNQQLQAIESLKNCKLELDVIGLIQLK